MRDMAVVLALMSYMKNVDQEDPKVIMYCRMIYGLYMVLVAFYHIYVQYLINAANDQRKIRIPPPTNPLTGAPVAPVAGAPPIVEEKTIRDYDMDMLTSQRKAAMTNVAVLMFVHFKMGSTSPLVISSVMGLLKLFDEPLFKIYVLKQPAEGKLERPFKPEPNPLLAMLGMGGNAANAEGDANAADSTADAAQSTTNAGTTPAITQDATVANPDGEEDEDEDEPVEAEEEEEDAEEEEKEQNEEKEDDNTESKKDR